MSPNPFWVAAERLPMLQTIYPGCRVEPSLAAPESERKRQWERPAPCANWCVDEWK